MRLVGRDILNPVQKQNKILDGWLSAWVCELIHARWWSPADVLNQFPKAQQCGNGLFLFQTEPKGYYIEVKIAFPQGIALITALTEHTEDNNE
jgi:mRNA-degrading endonuclease HigB of HigAB toxin-antitoxin module